MAPDIGIGRPREKPASSVASSIANDGAWMRSLRNCQPCGIDRLRLFVGPTGANYVVTADGQRHDLVVPSGAVDVVGDFDVEGCAIGHVTPAFAGKKSIVVHPLADGTNEWALRPIVRVREVDVSNTGCADDHREGEREPR
jgi:hypothetical protein